MGIISKADRRPAELKVMDKYLAKLMLILALYCVDSYILAIK